MGNGLLLLASLSVGADLLGSEIRCDARHACHPPKQARWWEPHRLFPRRHVSDRGDVGRGDNGNILSIKRRTADTDTVT